MKTKYMLALALAIAMLAPMMPMAAGAANEESAPAFKVADLIAGGGNIKGATDVGDILVWTDENGLNVKYMIVDPSEKSSWIITETHLDVKVDWKDIPQKNGNPIPGKFEYNEAYSPGVKEVVITLPLDSEWDEDGIFIAAHAVVVEQVACLKMLECSLPELVTLSVTYPYFGGPSYFPEMTISDGGMMNGVYQGWCIDTQHVIYQNTEYMANVFSSYETLPAGLVDKPANLDMVNWILNQGFFGKASSINSEPYTYSDIQYAIWRLIDDNPSTNGLYDLSEDRAAEIYDAAMMSGEGFVPVCDDVVAVILQPVCGAQIVIAEIPVPCCPIRCETAWGVVDGIDGLDDGLNEFPGKNWAEYIPYDG